MPRKIILIVAFLLLGFVIFATLSPIHLRPKTGRPNLERFAAFLSLGTAYGLALPRRTGLLAVLLVAGALGLEAAQGLAPTRDPNLVDALVKACGGLCGLGVARLVDVELTRRRVARDRAARAI